jgi:predicted ATPase/class 3 adenylate cyclase/Tfp pilus assembly protein PilF
LIDQTGVVTELPRGVVTFVFTDIEGSTRLLGRLGDRFVDLLRDHHQILVGTITDHRGVVVRIEGDGVFAAFASAPDALAATLSVQEKLAAQRWPSGEDVRVRIGVHTGPAAVVGDDYVGLAVHQAARIAAGGHGGQIVVSDASRSAAADALPNDASLELLGDYRLKDFDNVERLHQLCHPNLFATFPALRVASAQSHNLIPARTSFVGRDRELLDVAKSLERSHIVTVLGPGGVGKTRLALEAAASVLADYRDGVWLVELSDIGDEGMIERAVARVAGVREETGRPLIESLAEELESRQMLFVLDNCEHVHEACARIATVLLSRCPEVSMLATSRRSLGVVGEAEYRLRPLEVPAGVAPMEALASFDAVRLFVDRATLAAPDFVLEPANAASVVEVCRRLDGLPLALELAAARTALLAPTDIATHLDGQFRVLGKAARAGSVRQQTLEATIEWSYGLLSDEQQVLLRALAAFRGGATLDAVQAVVGSIAAAVLESLTALDVQSLIVSDVRGDVARYSLLETIREFARSRTSRGEREQFAEQHRRWFTTLATEAGPLLRGPDQRQWLARLELEHDNLREALRGALDHDPGAALELVVGLAPFWDARSHLAEGRRWVDAALDVAPRETTTLRTQAVGSAGRLALSQSDLTTARARFEEARELARALDDRRQMASIMNGLGSVEVFTGNYAAARERLLEALALAREIGDPQGVGAALGNLANASFFQGDLAAARAHYEESLGVFRAEGDARGIAISLLNLGNIAHHNGETAEARRDLEEALAMGRELGDSQIEAHALLDLGVVTRELGDPRASVDCFSDALTVARRIGNVRMVCEALISLATHPGSDPRRARRELHEALAGSRVIGDKHSESNALLYLARLERLDGYVEHAAARCRDALALASENNEAPTIELCMAELARLAAERGDRIAAATLLAGAATRAEETIGEHDDDAPLRAVRFENDDPSVVAARERGAAMTRDELVAWALEMVAAIE